MECIRGIKPSIGVFNIYGRIVHKKAKGCSHFYELLSTHDRSDGWESPCNKMESDLTNLDPSYDFDRESFFNNVKKIMSIKYFNRIKQFMIRLYRNDLSWDVIMKIKITSQHKNVMPVITTESRG